MDRHEEQVDGQEGARAGGSYEVLLQRLGEQSRELAALTDQLNQRRKELFGGTELEVIDNRRVRTENNCVPRDIIGLGDYLLFGYNVFIGMKTETSVDDVLSVHHRADLEPVGDAAGGAFLRDPSFVKEFRELYQYYKEARLLQLRVVGGKLLAVFQVGSAADDLKVFRWSYDGHGPLSYIDNRGERDHVFPSSQDFEWIATTREDQVSGRHPHVSILDQVFVETVGGDLTVKVEDNTEDGQGIYSEPVEDADQSLDDGKVEYAKVGDLILLRVLPFREDTWRYLVFCTRDQSVARIDAIGQSCIQLPEDHGVIFPGGFILQTGERKQFEGETDGLRFARAIRSPNGEDILYVFHRAADGRYVLLPYNLIRKAVQNPITCNGYSLFDDGTMVVFRSTDDEPTRGHPMQLWQTPFCSVDHTAQISADSTSYLTKVGNAELVRGISDAYSLCRVVEGAEESRQVFDGLIRSVTRMTDAYYWLGHAEVGDMATRVRGLQKTAEAVVDEFDKVVALRRQARQALDETQERFQTAERQARQDPPTSLEAFMETLGELRGLRGHVIGLHELRFVDHAAIDALDAAVASRFDEASQACFEFLLTEQAFAPLVERIEKMGEQVQAAEKTAELTPLGQGTDELAAGLDLLSDIAGGLQVGDPTERAGILERVSEVYGQLNRVRAMYGNRRKEIFGVEGRAEFAAQFQLLSQSVDAGLSRADNEEHCDEQLSALMVRLEEIEGQFSEFDAFVAELAAKREEIYEAFTRRKQTLVEERQLRAQNLFVAAERILDGVSRRASALGSEDELHSYFAADPMLLKLRELSARLRELGDSVKADDLDGRLKATKQTAARTLRDRSELFEGGDDVIRLGRHRFSVSRQPLELTMVPQEEGMSFHLTGTGFYQAVDDAAFLATRDFWDRPLISESPAVCRAEYLAFTVLQNALEQQDGLSESVLREARLSDDGLVGLVRAHMRDRYDEGYERGIHDADAAAILEQVLTLRHSCGLLTFGARPRAGGQLYWSTLSAEQRETWRFKAQNVARLRQLFGGAAAVAALVEELGEALAPLCGQVQGLELGPQEAQQASAYLLEELLRAPDSPAFVTRVAAESLRDRLLEQLAAAGSRQAFLDELRQLGGVDQAFWLALRWFEGLSRESDPDKEQAPTSLCVEAAALLLTGEALEHRSSAAHTECEVKGLLSRHDRILEGKLPVRIDEFMGRLHHFETETVAAYRAYRGNRHALIEQMRRTLRLDEYKPKVLTSFVRNKLISEVYLPLIGDNLAKQLGSLGAGKRTDLMGLLLLVSPPGYGKTTLMEYMASQLGLVFVKVNGPALGHRVTSLDPAEAPSATARQEVDKINFALEMGNNVMLYLDDIQHVDAELLQKFISLCDGQRRIEGVWHGHTKTYDLRGKRFCMVMAGNPYTESGEKFQIPDMLANRADTYNLGDILSGKEEVFALSYIENCLTANGTLAPVAARGLDDLYVFARMARGQQVQTSELSHDYTAAETGDVVAVLRHLERCRDVLLRVNRQYIDSAAQDDAYRTEPRFQLQGSYRNMAKLAERIAPAMNDDEVERLLDDHYTSEAQTLTSGAEHNLLKLAAMRGRLSDEQGARWEGIVAEFQRQHRMGGRDDDPAVRVVNQLGDIGERLDGIRQGVATAVAEASAREGDEGLRETLAQLGQALGRLERPRLELTVDTKVPESWAKLFEQQRMLAEQALYPLVENLSRSLSDSQALQVQLGALFRDLREIDQRLRDASFFARDATPDPLVEG